MDAPWEDIPFRQHPSKAEVVADVAACLLVGVPLLVVLEGYERARALIDRLRPARAARR